MNLLRPLALACALAAGPLAAAPLTDADFQAITDKVFRPVITEFAIPGMAVGVTVGGKSHVFTTGLADRAGGVAVDHDTLFELGSVSKLFNVALAAFAEQEGILSLDDPVSTILPSLKGSAFDDMTLYDLAAHANGGLPLQVPDEIASNAQLMDWLAAWRPQNNPQSVRAYSNVSIGLLGQIVGERFCGAYDVALEEYLLPKLGLENTFIKVPAEAIGRYAFGYSKVEDKAIRVTPGLLDAEAYGVKSSVLDMTRFLDTHLGNVQLPAPVKAALDQTRQARYDTAHFAQAMVWEEYRWPVDMQKIVLGSSTEMAMKPQPLRTRDAPMAGPIFLHKTGSTNGFGAYVAMVPDENIGVVVLANRNYPNGRRVEATLELIEEILAQLKR